jgi:hypothetical protein
MVASARCSLEQIALVASNIPCTNLYMAVHLLDCAPVGTHTTRGVLLAVILAPAWHLYGNRVNQELPGIVEKIEPHVRLSQRSEISGGEDAIES